MNNTKFKHTEAVFDMIDSVTVYFFVVTLYVLTFSSGPVEELFVQSNPRTVGWNQRRLNVLHRSAGGPCIERGEVATQKQTPGGRLVPGQRLRVVPHVTARLVKQIRVAVDVRRVRRTVLHCRQHQQAPAPG